MTILAKNIKKLRVNDSLTQKELAEEFSVSQNTIHMWETGKTEPNAETLQHLADYFKVDINYLLGYDISTLHQKKPSTEIESWLQQELDNRQISDKLNNLPEEKKQAVLNILQESVNAFYKDKQK